MALSLLCGGLGVASAEVDVKVAVSSAPDAVEVYTKTGVDTLLDGKADKGDVDTNKAAIQTLETGKANTSLDNLSDAGKAVIKTMMTDELEKKADKTYVDNALNDKADTGTVNALDGRVGGVEGKVTTLETTVGDASHGLVKDVADLRAQGNDLNTALGNKANQNDLDAANQKITENGNKITDLQKKTEKLSTDGTELKGMTTVSGTNVEAGALKVTGAISDGAGVNTTLADIKASMTQTAKNKTDIDDLKAKTTGQQTAIDGLNEKTTKITYDTALGTNVDGVTFNAGAVTGVTSINGTKIGIPEGGEYISQDGSIWGNLKTVDGQMKKNADNIETNKNAITALDTKVGTVGTGTYLDPHRSVGENLGLLDAGLKQEVADRTAADTALSDRIGTVTDDGEYIKKSDTKNVSENLIVLDTQAKTNAEAIAKETADRKAAIGELAVNGNYIEKDKNVSDNLVELDKQAKANADEIVKTNERTGGITRNLEKTQTTIESKVTVDNSGNVGGVKNLSAETINTTGNATIGGDLKVTGTITTDKMIFGDKATNNYTEIDHGKVTSKNLEVRAGGTISSLSTFDVEKNEVSFNSTTGDQSYHKQTAKGINGSVTDKAGNTTYTKVTATENSFQVQDKDGKNKNHQVNTKDSSVTEITDENGATSTKTEQTAKDITNTAKDGTITNDAQNIVNKVATMDTTVTGKATESYGELDTTVNGNETHHVTGKQTNKIDGNQENTIGGNQTTNVTGNISNTAENITNEANTQLTDKVGDNTRVTTSTSITDTVGTTTNRKIEDGKITDTAGDSTVVTENEKGTTFTKTGSTAYSTEADAPTDTNIAGNHITTGRVDANELKVSDKDDHGNTADFSVEAGEGVKASASNGTTTGSLDVKADEVGSSVKDASGKGSTFKQRIDAIMGNVKTDAGESEVTQKGDEITSQVGIGEATNSRVTQKKGSLEAAVTDGTNTNVSYDTANASAKLLTDGTKVNKQQDNLDSSEKTITNGTYSTSTVQRALDITHTAKDGTITHDAKDIVNNASNSITDKVGDHTRVLDGEGITDTVGGSTFKQRIDKIMMESKDVSIKAEETLTNEAKVITNKASEVINNEAININNTATGIITSKASEIKNQADKLISNKVGENTSEYMEDGKITTSVKDGAKSTVTIQNADGLQAAVTNGTSTNASATTATSSAQTIASGSKANSVITTIDGTQFVNSDAWAPVTGASGAGTAVNTTIKGNTITTGKVTMDYADVMRDLGVRGNATVDKDMTVKGNTTLGEAGKDTTLTVNSKATFNEKAIFEQGAEVKNGLTVSSGGLNVTGESTFNDKVTMKNGLDVTGGVASDSFTVKGTDIKIDSSGINAGGTVISNVADGSISEGSKDAVNGGQLYQVKNDLEGKVNKVGANAAAMANLHPMEFDPDSKWNIAAAMGNYGSETATAIGAFYRPNEDVMVNFSTAFGTGENMVGGGVSVRLGKGGNKLSREESNALKDQVNDLTARMDALLSVLNPNMSKDFPDVPENHWAYEAVSRLAGNDIVQGYPDGEFHGERTMTRYEMAEIIYNALSRGAEAEKELVEEFKPELQAMAASEKATAERAEG